LHDDFHPTKQDIEVRPDVRCIIPLVEGEFSAHGAVLDSRIVGENPTFGKCRLFGEIYREFTLCKTTIWLARC
jgi:hypothetical protein